MTAGEIKGILAWGAGILGSVIVLLIGWFANYFWSKHEDSIKLGAKIYLGGASLQAPYQSGGILVTVASRGKRQAKIKAVEVAVNIMAAGRLPRLEQVAVKLNPLSTPDAEEGFVLNRDDVCDFVLPIQCPCLSIFASANPDDVMLVVELFDRTKLKLLHGKSIQNPIKALLEARKGLTGTQLESGIQKA